MVGTAPLSPYPEGIIPPNHLSQRGYYSQGVYIVGNYARGFASFLSGSQLTPWRDIFFRVRETLCVVLWPYVTPRNPTAGQNDLRMKSFRAGSSPFFLWPLMLDGFRAVLTGQKPTATPRKKSEAASPALHSTSKRKSVDWNGYLYTYTPRQPSPRIPRQNYCAEKTPVFQ